jgi:hypothetical protein
MAFETHPGMTPDPHGDIHQAVAADRTVVDAVVDGMAKTATEFETELYAMFVGAYFMRDLTNLSRVAEMIMDFHGWKNGGGQTAVDAEAV